MAAFQRTYARIRRSTHSSPGNHGSFSGRDGVDVVGGGEGRDADVSLACPLQQAQHEVPGPVGALVVDDGVEGVAPFLGLFRVDVDQLSGQPRADQRLALTSVGHAGIASLRPAGRPAWSARPIAGSPPLQPTRDRGSLPLAGVVVQAGDVQCTCRKLEGKERLMQAKVGERLILKSHHVGEPDRARARFSRCAARRVDRRSWCGSKTAMRDWCFRAQTRSCTTLTAAERSSSALNASAPDGVSTRTRCAQLVRCACAGCWPCNGLPACTPHLGCPRTRRGQW